MITPDRFYAIVAAPEGRGYLEQLVIRPAISSREGQTITYTGVRFRTFAEAVREMDAKNALLWGTE